MWTELNAWKFLKHSREELNYWMNNKKDKNGSNWVFKVMIQLLISEVLES
jgi:hypothetical protein